ncbi:MAG TPA: hypothetical protein DCP06_00170 [Lachnospiraceae bacterium]|nr:hypothetical protein [Lachnospiraceae bacterium]
MITQATVSIIGVVLILCLAWGYVGVPAGRVRGSRLYLLLVAFSLMHLIGDGLVRALVGSPSGINMSSLDAAGVFYYMIYLVGIFGVLQSGFDIILAHVSDTTGKGMWVAVHLPVLVVVIILGFVGDVLMAPVMKYMPLIYALVLFFLAVMYYERLDAGLKTGLIMTVCASVVIFILNELFKVTELPLFTIVLVMAAGFGLMGRGIPDAVEGSVSEGVGITAKADDRVEVPKQEEAPTHEEPLPEAEDTGIELSELERMMQQQKLKEAEHEISDYSDTMRLPQLTPMEQLEVATVLTAESDSKTEDAMQRLQQVDETVTDRIHERPLILEKDLNEYYHRMKEAISNKDHDTCLEILSEMSEYRISGIHLTRYERIRHAVLDKEWKTVEKELKNY